MAAGSGAFRVPGVVFGFFVLVPMVAVRLAHWECAVGQSEAWLSADG
jgi:hypothetical protein